jgi:hypothetical protein
MHFLDIRLGGIRRPSFGIATFSLVILYIIFSLASFLFCAKDFHSRCSSIWFTLDLLLWLLVTYPAALLWTISIRSISVWW